MISQFGSPSVCVIDDEAADYEPMLAALLRQGIAAVHIRGKDEESTPSQPFKGLRLVLTDLHLGSSIAQKDHASHTASVFMRTVSPEHGPVLVVVWSKFANEAVPASEFAAAPEEDQPDLADLFEKTLLEAEPKFADVAIFARIPKPITSQRGDTDWIDQLRNDLLKVLSEYPALAFLWSWEARVRESSHSVLEEVVTLSKSTSPQGAMNLDSQAQQLFRVLATEQGGEGLSGAAYRLHLSLLLSQILSDQLEHSVEVDSTNEAAPWKITEAGLPKLAPFASRVNSALLASSTKDEAPPFQPGTVYLVTDQEKFAEAFGVKFDQLCDDCSSKLSVEARRQESSWKSQVVPILIELSPACDIHQKKRRKAFLVAGLAIPKEGFGDFSSLPSRERSPLLFNRWRSVGGFEAHEFFLVFSSYYKVTIPDASEPAWLKRWFRLRELPTASLRNWQAGHSARVGYVSLPPERKSN